MCRRALTSFTLADYLLLVWYAGFCVVVLREIVRFFALPLPATPDAILAVVAVVSWAAWLASLLARRMASPEPKTFSGRSPSDELWDPQLDG
jgi:hypothetical protein